ncbi:Tn3 family transposase [Candidatus Accumulibacter vicinus]|uniref:Transposase, TnpA family n=1 Tax=Candidatus Accumulibacter vicinus TaxID=2954382 RepID=A0A084Y4V4_9PROT|nr:MAG: Transposase, TnpA family [Candidatus Accumulibacter vicinus]
MRLYGRIGQALIDQTAMILPHVKITELLLEVDEWTGFTRHFTHLKSGDQAKDKNLLLTTMYAWRVRPPWRLPASRKECREILHLRLAPDRGRNINA